MGELKDYSMIKVTTDVLPVSSRDPVFHLDVRPAVDSPSAVYSRMTEWARVKKQTWTDGQSS